MARPCFFKVISVGIIAGIAWYLNFDLIAFAKVILNLFINYWYVPTIAILLIVIIYLYTQNRQLTDRQPDWCNYRTAIFFNVKWIWDWLGNNITNLTALCPRCDFELDTCNGFQIPGLPEGTMFYSVFSSGYQCKKCGFKKQIGDDFENIETLVCKEIEYAIRTGKYKR